MEYDNRNSGVLFKNEYKKNDKQPVYKGNITDEAGVEKDLAAWIRKSQTGKTFMSIKVSDKYQKEHSEQKANGYASQNDFASEEMDEAIPF